MDHFTRLSQNNFSHICETSYTGKLHLTLIERDVLITMLVISMLLNFFANSGVMYALITTKQLNNTSMHLIFYLCVSDCCLALISQPLFIVMLVKYSNSYDCNFETIVEFLVYFFAHVSAYFVGLIGYDRFFRMKYLNRYSQIVKSWKMNCSIAVIIVLSLIQTGSQVIGVQLYIYRQVKMAGIFIDLLIMLLMILPYILTVGVVKKHKNNAVNRRMLNKVDKTITSIASRILISIMVLYSPYIIFNLFHIFVDEQTLQTKYPWIHFSLFLGYQFGIANSFVNAIIFFSVNKKCQKKLFQLCQKESKSRLGVVEISYRAHASVSDTLVINEENDKY